MTKRDCQNRIKVVLADKQITNRWLAKQMGVTNMTVSSRKTNKIQLSMVQFVEIARLLQVDIKDLLEVGLDAEKNAVSGINTMVKDFADEMTNVNIQTKKLQYVVSIKREYIDNNSAICKMLKERGIILEALSHTGDFKK